MAIRALAARVVVLGGCGGMIACGAMLAGCGAGGASGGTAGGATQEAAAAAPEVSVVERVKVGEAMRLEGDAGLVAEFQDGVWRSGTAAIPTPLPVGYPAPTPPGTVELKRYPVVRRAEVGSTRGAANAGRTAAFFPLFNHITRRDIEMTSPVEMESKAYDAAAGVASVDESGAGEAGVDDAAGASRDEAWAMSFLYREVEQGTTGRDEEDGRVRVFDTPEMVVVSRGFQGNYSDARIERELTAVAEWIAADGRMEPAGRARVLMYNGGPGDDPRKYWGEVQLPVRAKSGG
jgi:hypothetical protein